MLVRKQKFIDVFKRDGMILFLLYFLLNPIGSYILFFTGDTFNKLSRFIQILFFVIVIIRFIYVLKVQNNYYVVTPGSPKSNKLVTGDKIGLPNKFKDLSSEQQRLLSSFDLVKLADLVSTSSLPQHKDDPFKQEDCKYNIDKDDPFEDFYKKK